MGEVTPFRIKGRARAESAPPEGTAQILFFLGVRYEREKESLDSKAGADGVGRLPGATLKRRKKKSSFLIKA